MINEPKLTGIHHDGRPTTREWMGLLMNIPQFWNRVHGVIEQYQEKKPNWPEVEREQYNRCVNISIRWQVKAQIIQPFVFAVVFWLFFDVILPKMPELVVKSVDVSCEWAVQQQRMHTCGTFRDVWSVIETSACFMASERTLQRAYGSSNYYSFCVE